MNLIWFALLIPMLAAIVLKILFKREVTLWEMFAMVGLCGVVIGIMALIGSTIPKTEEYWGGVITHGEYEEPWTEYVHKTCSERYACGSHTEGTGKDAHTVTDYCTRYYDCSYYDDHPAMWTFYESNGATFAVDAARFNYLCKKWNNKTYVNMFRARNHDMTYPRCVDGNMYMTRWFNKWDDMEPAITLHHYLNKVKYSTSTFNFADIKDSLTLKKMIPYPPIQNYYDCRSVLGYQAKGWQRADQELTKWNALKGKQKQVRMYILLFKNEPLDIAEYQERYWKGGNMNEFIVMIGVNDTLGINWCHVTSWTENQQLKINVRNFVTSMGTLDFYKIVPYIGASVEQGFKRKDFAKDFDYLDIEPSTTEVMITYILTILIVVGFSYWSVTNEFVTEQIRD